MRGSQGSDCRDRIWDLILGTTGVTEGSNQQSFAFSKNASRSRMGDGTEEAAKKLLGGCSAILGDVAMARRGRTGGRSLAQTAAFQGPPHTEGASAGRSKGGQTLQCGEMPSSRCR